MKELVSEDCTGLTLGQLREFILNELSQLPDDTPITMDDIVLHEGEDFNKVAYSVNSILADEDSVELMH